MSFSTNSESLEVIKPEVGSAKEFLTQNGFRDLITVLVDKHKFQDIDDLRLLGNNAEMINTLEIPLCTILRLKDKLNNLCEEKAVKPPTKEAQKELSKKQLVKLCKTNLSAQVANHGWNRFNSMINRKVKELSNQNKTAANQNEAKEDDTSKTALEQAVTSNVIQMDESQKSKEPISKDTAIMVALHYLKAKKISRVPSKVLKKQMQTLLRSVQKHFN